MNFWEKCASGEFHNRPTWTDSERMEYLVSRGSDPIYGKITFQVNEEELKQREADIKAGIIKF